MPRRSTLAAIDIGPCVSHGVVNNKQGERATARISTKRGSGRAMSSLMLSRRRGSAQTPVVSAVSAVAAAFSRFSSQIAAVAIGWQIYDLTGSAFDLGMVGLVQFLPTALLVFVGRPCRRPLRAQARHAALPARAGADGGVSRVGRLCRLADGAADLHRDRRAGNGRRVRESGDGGAAAADRRRRARCSARPRCRAAPPSSPPSPAPRSAAWPMPSRPACPTASWWCSGCRARSWPAPSV